MLWFTDKTNAQFYFLRRIFSFNLCGWNKKCNLLFIVTWTQNFYTFCKNHAASQQPFWNPCCISTVKASSKSWIFSKTLLNYKTIWTWLHWFSEKFPCFALALSCVTKWMQIILLKVKIHISKIHQQSILFPDCAY